MTSRNGLRDNLSINFTNIPKENVAQTETFWTNYAHQGKLTIPNRCTDLPFGSEEMEDYGEIGRGNYGCVNKMKHRPTSQIMAVKRIRSTLDENQQHRTLKDLDVVMKSANCPYIVLFYGALFREGDCWICMELMATSLDKFYKYVYQSLNQIIPESILGKVTVAMVKALDYLKVELNVIHRDVKPSNILIDRDGYIKLCDFGISGQLIDSIAKSRDAGCKPYMAPERIDPKLSSQGYDVRSDVWSLGITLMELGTGRFPYPTWDSVFDQLTCVLNKDPPAIDDAMGFTAHFQSFLRKCLEKHYKRRPKYDELRKHPFFINCEFDSRTNVSEYFCQVLDSLPDSATLDDVLQTSTQSSPQPPLNSVSPLSTQ